MKNAIIYVTLFLMITSIIGACKSDEDDAATTSSNTCTGTSSGSGPTIGSVALEEATYLSSCFSGKKLQLQFKNSTEAQYTSYSYSDNSCSTLTSTYNACMTPITISSTAVSKQTKESNYSDNATGYNATAKWLHDSTGTSYLQFSADNASGFRFNQSGSESGRNSNTVWYFTFTKQ